MVVVLVVLGVVLLVVVVALVVLVFGLTGLTALDALVVGLGRGLTVVVVEVPNPGHWDQKSPSSGKGVSKLSLDSLIEGFEVARLPGAGTVVSSISELTGGKSDIPGKGLAITPESGT